MEQAEKEMNEASEQQRNSIRKYLLGSLDDQAEMRQIEEKLLLDDDFAERLSIAENDLAEEYLDGTLTEPERERFLRFFLVPPENKEKLRLVGNLRKYAATRPAPHDTPQLSERSTWFDWRNLFSSPALRLAGGILILFGVGFGIWRVVFYQSDIEKGLADLRLAYGGMRPTESRTTVGFDYAPLSAARGNTSSAIDEKAHRRAELLLSGAAENSPDAEAHHALGLLYTADKKYDRALEEFNAALKLAPDNARLHSDAGAALLENARQAETNGKFDEALENFALSLKSVNRALEIDGSLTEALFNKALILQRMRLPNQAREAWEQYLRKDSVSPWAEEARRNLELLRRQNPAPKDKSQILQDFLDAFRGKDDARAWEVASQTKELVTGVMPGQQLARKLLEAAEQKSRIEETSEILSAFAYLGRLESQNAEDPFFRQLAEYYSKTDQSKRNSLRLAHAGMDRGYELLLKGDWRAAFESFQTAKDVFSETGDIWEAGIAEYQICYCLCQLKQIKESSERLEILSKESERKKHRWLQSLADGWAGNNYSILGEHSKAISYAQKSFVISSAISDTYNSQKVANHLTHEYLLLGNPPKALADIYHSFNFTNVYFSSSRQRSRNLLIAARALSSFGYYDAAAAIGLEQLHLSQVELKDVWLSHTARNQLALIYGKGRKYEAAFTEIEAGFQLASSFSTEAMRRAQTTETRLILAHLQKEAGDCRQAADNYSQVIEDYADTDFSIYKYEARKGRLVCFVALKEDEAVMREMPILLRMFDANRRAINEESDRNIFFDNEQSVYDIAADYAYARLADSERAFDYAENSRARSLLNQVKPGQATPPLTLQEISRRMPSGIQIIYYAALEDKLLIWLISDSQFITAERAVGAGELKDMVEKYKNLLIEKKDSRSAAKTLYELLITPLEARLEPDKPLCIIADKSLFRLPFAALVSPQTNRYLIEDHSLLYAPSATIFVSETEIAGQKSTNSNESLLSVGNPSFTRAEYPELSDLPDAKREAETIAALYTPAKLFTGGEAGKERVVGNLDEADVLHFATHYVPNAKSPGRSKLLLAAGDLAVEEIVGKKLPRARLVILSACETGIESFYKGEGMIGAARAFLAADVPLVVASQWAVDSEATAELMIKFHSCRRQKKMATIDALRRAQIDMLTKGDTRFNQPHYWAAFLPIGGYAVY